jgi:GAF domain-containing protein
MNGRDGKKLKVVRKQIRVASGSDTTTVVADVTTESGRTALVDACPSLHILVTNNAGASPGSIEDWHHEAWTSAWRPNMLPIVAFVRGELGIASSLANPIVVEGRLWGLLYPHTEEPHRLFTRDVESRLMDFTKLLATAIAVAQSRA